MVASVLTPSFSARAKRSRYCARRSRKNATPTRNSLNCPARSTWKPPIPLNQFRPQAVARKRLLRAARFFPSQFVQKEEQIMNRRFLKSPRMLLVLATAAFSMSLLATPMLAQDSQQAPADNAKQNKDQTPPTADQQKMNPADRAITEKIRKAIHDV